MEGCLCLPCRCGCNEKAFRNELRLRFVGRYHLKVFHLDCHPCERKDWDFLNVSETVHARKGRGVALQD